MNGLPYYKRYPRDFIEGTAGMPFEIKCAYSFLLDLIYMHGGDLPDDPRYISGHLGVSVRKWNSIKSTLIGLRKISVNAKFLTNYRAVSELESLRKYQDKQSENARASNKNKDLEKPRLSHTEPDTEPYKNDDDNAREAQTFRERILTAIGVDPISGLTGRGASMIGTPADMIEAGRWTGDLGLTEAQVIDQISHIMAKKRNGPPSSFGYFSRAMQEFAGKVSTAAAEPMKPEVRKVDMQNPKIDDLIVVKGVTKRYAGNGVGWVVVHD